MGLSSFKMPTVAIPLPGGGSFDVRGLNTEDLGKLLTSNLESISKAAALYMKSKADVFASKNFTQFILVIAKDFPGLVREVIAIAADEPDATSVRLPIAVQMAALVGIGRLTVQDAGGLGNLSAVLGAAFQGEKGDSLRESLTTILSPTSTGESEKT